MGFRDRLRRLEQEANADPSCEECEGMIVYEVIAEDGTVTYPHGEPCPSCSSRGSGGGIGWITVDKREAESRGEIYLTEYY